MPYIQAKIALRENIKTIKHGRECARRHERYCPRPVSATDGTPFDSVEDAWMWSVQATVARYDGAKIIAGQGETPRPCEPLDVMSVVSRMSRERRLSSHHVSVLVRYGRRCAAPDSKRQREFKDARLWDEALDTLSGPLRERGIIL